MMIYNNYSRLQPPQFSRKGFVLVPLNEIAPDTFTRFEEVVAGVARIAESDGVRLCE